ncbi:MAG: DinB family protein [Calditrichaeota bacterium]|nr:MAG: DinB family protein [Calditrichota bacterium]MBL1205316.1 DinB family protein [Calditrichota bacterium]NOG45145.1 DinB family protein [Calditrichota bacterium]
MATIIESLKSLFERDLKRLKKQVELYSDESALWIVDKEINNSAGNLCLHLFGNLQYFIGNVLGDSGYIRDREKEFSVKNISRIDLLSKLQTTQDVVKQTLSGLTEKDLEKIYPEQVLGYEMTTAFFLIHLNGHLNYHLGQINYHRRLLG